ncbi:KTSC domain-containing protein [Paraburkholderia tuberum]|uniref:KTSC domain-containing protein n=2 Tax=Paraburkholderia tuberum TaxID=157910 RepID=A0A1H1GVQ0_9BURK|nr:KTSC domain-containing protein [Paraburkholderia tuberum]
MNTPTPKIAMDAVESSQIHSIGYDPSTGTLAVRFKDGKTGAPTSLYYYSNFTPSNFEALRQAKSIGTHFHHHIRPFPHRFPCVCVEKKPYTGRAS